MKKYIALLLVLTSLALSACSSAPAEDTAEDTPPAEETVLDTSPETEETEAETKPAPPVQNEEYVNYKNLHMGVDPVYDKANNLLVLYFEDKNIWYTEDAACYVAYISDTAANSIDAKPDLTAYPDMLLDNGDYCGVALRLDGEIPAGTYEIAVSFASYSCSFEMTVQ